MFLDRNILVPNGTFTPIFIGVDEKELQKKETAIKNFVTTANSFKSKFKDVFGYEPDNSEFIMLLNHGNTNAYFTDKQFNAHPELQEMIDKFHFEKPKVLAMTNLFNFSELNGLLIHLSGQNREHGLLSLTDNLQRISNNGIFEVPANLSKELTESCSVYTKNQKENIVWCSLQNLASAINTINDCGKAGHSLNFQNMSNILRPMFQVFDTEGSRIFIAPTMKSYFSENFKAWASGADDRLSEVFFTTPDNFISPELKETVNDLSDGSESEN